MNGPRILIVSGIWPPSVGGPASHGVDLAEFLVRRGHRVRALTSTAGRPEEAGFPLATTDPGLPLPLRMADASAKIVRDARKSDVIYATGLYHRSALASVAAAVPLVVKLVNDPAYERSRNWGLFEGTLEEFQGANRNQRMATLKRVRNAMLRRARAVIVPSRYLAGVVERWPGTRSKVFVVANPAPEAQVDTPRRELRREFGMEGPSAVFAGRFVLQKNLPLAVAAMRRVPDATLFLVGDGDQLPAVHDRVASLGLEDRVRIQPAVSREETLRWLRAADVSVLSSSWENYPHAVVESLTVGTPVVATRVGGVPEIAEDGVNALLVDPGDEAALADALTRALHDESLQHELRAGTRRARVYTQEQVLSRIEEIILIHAAKRPTGEATEG